MTASPRSLGVPRSAQRARTWPSVGRIRASMRSRSSGQAPGRSPASAAASRPASGSSPPRTPTAAGPSPPSAPRGSTRPPLEPSTPRSSARSPPRTPTSYSARLWPPQDKRSLSRSGCAQWASAAERRSHTAAQRIRRHRSLPARYQPRYRHWQSGRVDTTRWLAHAGRQYRTLLDGAARQ